MNELKPAQRLLKVQSELIAPKNQLNKFGGYKYRSQEDILQAVKPLLAEHDLYLVLCDEIENIEGRFYVKAVATIFDAIENTVVAMNSAFAREPEAKKGMDDSQITGTASSYARKYALNGLFLIDDTKDADTDEHHIATKREMPAALKKLLKDKNVSELEQHVKDNQSSMIATMPPEAKKILKAAGYNDFSIIGIANLACGGYWNETLKVLGVAQ